MVFNLYNSNNVEALKCPRVLHTKSPCSPQDQSPPGEGSSPPRSAGQLSSVAAFSVGLPPRDTGSVWRHWDMLIVTTREAGATGVVGREHPITHRLAPPSRESPVPRSAVLRLGALPEHPGRAQGIGSAHRDGSGRGPPGRAEAGSPREPHVPGSHEGLWLRKNLEKKKP